MNPDKVYLVVIYYHGVVDAVSSEARSGGNKQPVQSTYRRAR